MAGDAAVVAVEELAAAVEGLEERSRYEALPEETLARARELVAASRAAGRTDLEMRALLVEGDLEFRRGRTGTTGRIFREVNRWAVEHEDQAVLARSHRRLADYFTQLGNPQLALEHAVHAVEALDLVQDVPDRLRARFILTLADAYGDTGALDEARERYEQAERLSAAIDEVWWRMRVLNNRAYTEYEAKDLAAADRTIRRLVRLAEEQGVDLDLHAVDTIGRVQLATGHVADAVKTLLPALDDEYAGRFEENSARADALLSLAEAQRLAGDLGPAEDALDACRRLCHERELAAIATRAIQEEAALLAAHGRYREAYERHRAFHAETMARYSAERDSRARALQVVYETYEARRDHRRAHELSLRDPLTQLYNRRHVDDELPALLRQAAADGTPLSVALVDIDHFKLINDRHSHEVGDVVLQAIAGVITRTGAAHGAASFGARLGGEEFLLVLPGADVETAYGCAERLRLAISGYDWGSVRDGLAVTASVGLATAPDGRADHRDLLRLADANLYAAKGAGRDRTVAGQTA